MLRINFFFSAFSLHNTLFVAVRLVSLILSILTIQFGLGSAGNQELNLATGNFNILPIRYKNFVFNIRVLGEKPPEEKPPV